MKPSFTLCFFEERFSELRAQRHDGGHVDLVECREQCRSLLDLDEPLGNGAAQPAHGDNFFLAFADLRRSGRWRGFGRLGRGRFCFGSGAQDIFFQHAAARSGGFDRFGLNAVFGQRPGRGRHDVRRRLRVES